jgi:hypothetical protein
MSLIVNNLNAGGSLISEAGTGLIKITTGAPRYVSEYTSFASAITAIGSTVQDLVIDTLVTISANTTCPSNINLQFSNAGYFSVGSGKTLTINRLDPAAPLRQIFSGDGSVLLSCKNVYPEWWGAAGDGVTDDTLPIRKMASSVGGYNQPRDVIFSNKKYRITKTIFWSDWSSSYGSTGSFSWQGENHFWGGGWTKDIHQLNIYGCNNELYAERSVQMSGIWFDGAGSYPIFVFIGGRSVRIENLFLNGLGDAAAASEGIFVTGGSQGFICDNVVIKNCKRCFRIGNNVHWADDPVIFTDYENPTDYPTTYGGWQVEDIAINKCEFWTRTSGYSSTDCCISLESVQAVNTTWTQQFLKSLGNYSIYVHSGRATLVNPAFLGSASSDIYLPSDNNSSKILILGGHTESVSGVCFTNARQADLGSSNIYTFIDFDGSTYNTNGNLNLNIIGGKANNVYSNVNLDSDDYATISMDNVLISGRVGCISATYAPKTILNLKCCKFVGATADIFSDYVSYHKSNIITGCTFDGGSYPSAAKRLESFPMHISGNRDANLGQLILSDNWYGVAGIAGTATNLNLLFNAYKNKSGAGVMYASTDAGGFSTINQYQFDHVTFSSQTGDTAISSTSQLFKFYRKSTNTIPVLVVGPTNVVGFNSVAPTTDAWTIGDIIIETSQTNTGMIQGWKCTSSGTPGTWVRFGNVLTILDTTDTTAANTGSMQTKGGLYVEKNILSGATIAGPKVKLTPEGGIAVLLTNKTGGNSVKGEVVTAYASANSAVAKVIVDVPNPIGVFYESGIADAAEAWVVVSGIADVYFIGNTTRGHIARGFLTADGAGYVTGQALSEAVPSSPFASDKHFYEIGHVIESRTGAGLAKVVLHFN